MGFKMKKNFFIVLTLVLLIFSGCKSKKEVVTIAFEKGSDKEMYERAKKYVGKNSDKARLLFKQVVEMFPESIYAKKSKVGIADSYFKQKDSASLVVAAAEYQEYVNLYPNSPDAIYAKYQIGMCYFKQVRKPERDQSNTFEAIRAFESLLKQYPDTHEAEEAKKKIKILRQTLATHYFRIGYYNYKFKAYRGAIARFKQVIDEYPEFKKNDKLFFFAGKSYLAIRKFDTAISFFQKIINSYPKSKYFKKSHRMIKKINKIDREALEKKRLERIEKQKRKFEKRRSKK